MPTQFREPNRQSERDLRRMSRRMQPIWRVLDRSHILQFICTTDDVETDIENESGSKKEKKVEKTSSKFVEKKFPTGLLPFPSGGEQRP